MAASVPSDAERAETLAAVFAKNFADVWRFVRRRTVSAADADDVAAEVFAVACRRQADLPPPNEVRLWLFGVARRVLANHHRGMARRRRLHQRLEAQAPLSAVEPPEGDGALLAGLAALSHDDRDLLIMRAWDGLAVTEMASVLGVTPNAVSLRLTKARKRLAKVLAQTDDRTLGHDQDDPELGEEERAHGRSSH